MLRFSLFNLAMFISCTTNFMATAMQQDPKKDLQVLDWNTLNKLRALIYEGKTTDIEKMLNKGVSAKACSELGYSILQTACENGQLDIVMLLLKRGALANARPNYYNSNFPIHSAIQASPQSLPMVELLIQYGADASAQGHDNATPLHVTAEVGQVAVCQMLITKAHYGIVHRLEAHEKKENKSALIAQERLRVVKRLLATKDRYERTPLIIATNKLAAVVRKPDKNAADEKLKLAYMQVIALLELEKNEPHLLKLILEDVNKILENAQKNHK